MRPAILAQALVVCLAVGVATPARAQSDLSCTGCHSKLEGGPAKHADFAKGGCRDCHTPGTEAGNCTATRKRWTLRLDASRSCMECHRSSMTPPPGGGVHTPVRAGQCLDCHSAHPTPRGRLLKFEAKDFCLSCHGPKGAAKVRVDPQAKGTHRVVRTGGCMDCHVQTHSAKNDKLLSATPPDICWGCHDREEDLRHLPVKEGRCTACHDPHRSDNAKLLRQPDSKLCLMCHQAGSPEGPGTPAAKARLDLAKPALHAPVSGGSCTDCHAEGHGGKAEKLLVKPAPGLCYACHPKDEKDEGLHAAVKMGRCMGCHDPHAGELRLLRKASGSCTDCHDLDGIAPGTEKHAPVVEGRCLDCHAGHRSKNRLLLKADGKELCLSCHDAQVPGGKGKPSADCRVDPKAPVVHVAFKKGCGGCHEMQHSANHPNLLLKRVDRLCLECHERGTDKYAHGALKNGDCAVCHDPHSTKDEKLLRNPDTKQACFQCHANDLAGRTRVHRPIKKDGCGACHGSHGGQHPNSLKERGKKLCYGCHEPVDTDPVRHAVLDRKGCNACHDAHASNVRGMLAKPVNELCSSCHAAQKDGRHVSSGGHVVSGGRDPRDVEREFSCISCHQPHSSKSPKLLFVGDSPTESCDGCHGDRTGKRPELKNIIRNFRARYEPKQDERPAVPEGPVVTPEIKPAGSPAVILR